MGAVVNGAETSITLFADPPHVIPAFAGMT